MNRIISVTGALSIYVAIVYSISLCLSANKKARRAYREAYIKAVEDAWFKREETLDRVENEAGQMAQALLDQSIWRIVDREAFTRQHFEAIQAHVLELREPRPQSCVSLPSTK